MRERERERESKSMTRVTATKLIWEENWRESKLFDDKNNGFSMGEFNSTKVYLLFSTSILLK
jgi:hypothetical protein